APPPDARVRPRRAPRRASSPQPPWPAAPLRGGAHPRPAPRPRPACGPQLRAPAALQDACVLLPLALLPLRALVVRRAVRALHRRDRQPRRACALLRAGGDRSPRLTDERAPRLRVFPPPSLGARPCPWRLPRPAGALRLPAPSVRLRALPAPPPRHRALRARGGPARADGQLLPRGVFPKLPVRRSLRGGRPPRAPAQQLLPPRTCARLLAEGERLRPAARQQCGALPRRQA